MTLTQAREIIRNSGIPYARSYKPALIIFRDKEIIMYSAKTRKYVTVNYWRFPGAYYSICQSPQKWWQNYTLCKGNERKL